MEVLHLLFELKLIDDILHILGEAIKILQEILFESLLIGFSSERAHREGRAVEEGISRCLNEE